MSKKRKFTVKDTETGAVFAEGYARDARQAANKIANKFGCHAVESLNIADLTVVDEDGEEETFAVE